MKKNVSVSHMHFKCTWSCTRINVCVCDSGIAALVGTKKKKLWGHLVLRGHSAGPHLVRGNFVQVKDFVWSWVGNKVILK